MRLGPWLSGLWRGRGDANGETVAALRRLNFKDLIRFPKWDQYDFDTYRANGHRHPTPEAYCTSCESRGVHRSTKSDGFLLGNVSHGAHSRDFLSAMRLRPTRRWHDEGVLFVFESPSAAEFFERLGHEGHAKRPTTQWYWVHTDLEPRAFPYGFKGGAYGELIQSTIVTFKLSNVYATNLVKCGMTNPEGTKFEGVGAIPSACVEHCLRTFLTREIAILKPRVIFAFGTAVEGWLKQLLANPPFIRQLPHPAGRRRGLRDDHYEVLYFWLILRALVDAGVIPHREVRALTNTFLRRR